MSKKPKNLKLINKVGVCAELSFAHALAVLREEHDQGRDDWKIDPVEQYQFTNNEIIRVKSNKKDKKTPKS